MNAAEVNLSLILIIGAAAFQLDEKRHVMPADFHNEIIYVTPQLENGIRLRFLTDTGGGTFIYGKALEMLGIKTSMETSSISMPNLDEGSWIPEPIGAEGQLYIYRGDPPKGQEELTGLLGAYWFADRAWLFDYPGQELILLTDYKPPAKNPDSISFHFQKDSDGNKTTHFPRISVEIDGEIIEMLFDTGAQVELSESAEAWFGDHHGRLRATSFIVASIFNRWREQHPDWPVIKGGDETLKEDMIRVPEVSIAGSRVGPVWFTRREDSNFHEYMSKWMDMRIDGAIGGSCLKYFRIIVDYRNETAQFTLQNP